MSKVKVYIDFEAISAPFRFKIKAKHDVPYAYSIGIMQGKKFKTKTHIINFNEVAIADIDKKIKSSIITNINQLVKKSDFKISKDTIEFLAYSPNLEKQILNKMFPHFSVSDVSKGQSISLERATENETGKKEYFFEFRKLAKQNLSEAFFIKRGLNRDGALAALAGFVLLAQAHKIKSKFTFNFNIKTLLSEIKKYSKDDVIRMKIITDDFAKFKSRSDEWTVFNTDKNKFRKENRMLSMVMKYLSTQDPKKSLPSLISNVKKTIDKNQSEIDKEIKFK